MSSEYLKLNNTSQKISVSCADISGSDFNDIKAEKLLFNNVNLSDLKITDANLSNLEIDGAQIGGAYIHNIGMPPECHPYHDPNNTIQRPVRFEDCDLNNSTIIKSNLTNVQINDCEISGIKINGILVEELLKLYFDNK